MCGNLDFDIIFPYHSQIIDVVDTPPRRFSGIVTSKGPLIKEIILLKKMRYLFPPSVFTFCVLKKEK